MKKNNCIVLAVCFLTAWLFSACVSQTTSTPSPGSRPPADKPLAGLTQVTEALIRDLNSQMSLSNQSVQVVGNNFCDGKTKTILPFSNVLSDALAPHLTRLGANVTVQERGESPMRIVGTYSRDEVSNTLVITLRLRQMEDDGSSDTASAQGKMQLSPKQSGWFKFSYENTAQAMIASLLTNYNYRGNNFSRIGKIELVPREDSRMPIKFGESFKPYLKTALSSLPSAPFDYTGNGDSRLRGHYAVMQDQSTGFLEVAFDIVGPDGKTNSSSSVFHIDSTYVFPEDWMPAMTVAVMPASGASGAAVQAAVKGVAGYLAKKDMKVIQKRKYASSAQLKKEGIRVAIEVKLSELTEGKNIGIVAVRGHAEMRDINTRNDLGNCAKSVEQELPSSIAAVRTEALKRASGKTGERMAKVLYAQLMELTGNGLNR